VHFHTNTLSVAAFLVAKRRPDALLGCDREAKRPLCAKSGHSERTNTYPRFDPEAVIQDRGLVKTSLAQWSRIFFGNFAPE
jgi:hypothetical protein